jgi:hypothetical protein
MREICASGTVGGKGGNILAYPAVKSLLSDVQSMEEATADVYGERGVKIRYRVRDLMWRPVGQLVRFVAVVHPTRGNIVLMTTDLALCPLDASMAFVSRSSTCSGKLCV